MTFVIPNLAHALYVLESWNKWRKLGHNSSPLVIACFFGGSSYKRGELVHVRQSKVSLDRSTLVHGSYAEVTAAPSEKANGLWLHIGPFLAVANVDASWHKSQRLSKRFSSLHSKHGRRFKKSTDFVRFMSLLSHCFVKQWNNSKLSQLLSFAST